MRSGCAARPSICGSASRRTPDATGGRSAGRSSPAAFRPERYQRLKTYRVAVLGCGMRGTAHARAYHAHPRTELVALCDRVQERLDTLGDTYGVRDRFTDADA